MDKNKKIMESWTWLAAALLLLAAPVAADDARVQTIQLQKGWNAVYLEVDPVQDAPDDIFAGLPVAQAVTYYPAESPVQFIRNPDEKPWKREGWSLWIPPGHPGALLNSLFKIHGGQAYLIHCSDAAQWQVRGRPNMTPRRWEPESFNLVGFEIDPAAAPTFAQYFDGSSAHADLLIYQLRNNVWSKVEEPGETKIESGRAYWVWCKHGSDFQGPLSVSLSSSENGLMFRRNVAELSFEIHNDSAGDRSFQVELIGNGDNAANAPLSLVGFDVDDGEQYAPLTVYAPDDPIEAGESVEVTLAVRRAELATDEVSNLIRISGGGTMRHIPVTAQP